MQKLNKHNEGLDKKMTQSTILVLGSMILAFLTGANAQADYRDVLVVINSNSSASDSIGSYFIAQRQIPASNVVRVNVPALEEIDSTVFSSLRSQIETYLVSNNLTEKINYIVTTKGLPLKVNRGNTFSTISPSSSVESELMLILSPNSRAIGQNGMIMSPYFYKSEHFSRTTFGIYLVTRLDGYTVSDVKALIDRSAQPVFISPSTKFVFDLDPAWNSSLPALNNEMKKAASLLNTKGLSTHVDTSTLYVTKQNNVIGYASWGSNDHYAHQYTQYAKPSHQWADGAIGETYVSTSGRTFSAPVSYGQSVIADLVAEGITGIKGYVYEPYSVSMSLVSILFDRYTSGYNLAESYFMSSRYLSWMDVIIGDPKMQVYTNKTIVKNINGATNPSTGKVSISWSTVVEYRNIGFNVERVKVVNAKPQGKWGTVGFITGNGTTLQRKDYSFDESNLKPGLYYYRLRQLDSSGIAVYSDSIGVNVSKAVAIHAGMVNSTNSVTVNDSPKLANYPNPFNPETEIRFKIDEAGTVILNVYNSIGQQVAQLINREMNAGDHSVTFNGSNLSSGVYFMQLQTSTAVQIQKMIMQK